MPKTVNSSAGTPKISIAIKYIIIADIENTSIFNSHCSHSCLIFDSII